MSIKDLGLNWLNTLTVDGSLAASRRLRGVAFHLLTHATEIKIHHDRYPLNNPVKDHTLKLLNLSREDLRDPLIQTLCEEFEHENPDGFSEDCTSALDALDWFSELDQSQQTEVLECLIDHHWVTDEDDTTLASYYGFSIQGSEQELEKLCDEFNLHYSNFDDDFFTVIVVGILLVARKRGLPV